MIRLTLIALLLLSSLGYSGESTAAGQIAGEHKLSTFSIPITEGADATLSKILKHHLKGDNDALSEFFQMQGIAFPEGSSCSLDSQRNLIIVTNTHYNSSLIVAIMGDLMLKVGKQVSDIDLWRRYSLGDSECGCFFGNSNNSDKNKGEQSSAQQSTTRPESKSE